MYSIVQELQADALNSSVSVANLLRKAKVVTFKLVLGEFGAWIEHELTGYQDGAAVPPYRSIVGELYALNPFHGWRPLMFQDSKQRERLRQYEVRQSVGEIADLLDPSRGNGTLAVPLGSPVVSYGGLMSEPTNVQLQFDRAAFAGILDAVRNVVLDWSLKLEKAGIVGDGLSFSEHEKQKAQEAGVVVNIGRIESLIGNVSGISGPASINSNQIGDRSAGQIDEVKEFLAKVKGYETQLPASARRAFAEVQKEVTATAPNPSRIMALLNSLKTSLEGAAGDIIAAGVLAALNKLIG